MILLNYISIENNYNFGGISPILGIKKSYYRLHDPRGVDPYDGDDESSFKDERLLFPDYLYYLKKGMIVYFNSSFNKKNYA